ncbi:FdhF/YdeP family oxidoreductase [Thermoflexus sp.]|uniref:FdhF/YdeP family oxidoreductase n=2 Tax=Thermoflexus sp. TaxID=1969742 RepID=UPI0025DDC346|nr:FdhF/YdeP family oxidoreductase [Thermoflexus sp.]MCS7352103.1 FdhF/YdeP family oxidoreductase [Thermoflexus sp.]MCX7690595.1 FdhF/YdeP family oxidoreductase [Thermoflexus sp.]MDW8181562.1 FdhF/YdeP family oxidoreductase [Anaerolineae bacterium]MDW8185047.1 FdhF/YdeP family oxidoreductase [Anaerolineae bacterium]
MGGVRQAVRPPARRWMPHLWASWKPFGIGEQRPNNYLEILRAIWENRDQLGYAWRILRDGVCDGCALGTAGMRDWTITGIHLCNIRLRLLRLNTMPPLDIRLLSDVRSLAQRSARELRALGRLPYPMIRHRGEPGFRRISWDEALDFIAGFIHRTAPQRLGFYLTSRGLPNEAYYVAQKAVRAMGTNSIDNAARVCHAPSTLALRSALGVAATTCSYTDLIGTDLIVFFGSNVANNQPVMMKYLYYARKAGTRVALVNPYREPAMERYWVPSDVESALFGTRITDRFFQIRVGGDIAFIHGAIRHMIEQGWMDEAFIRAHTTGFEELQALLMAMPWEELEESAGLSREEMLDFARMVAEAQRAVFVWSMGITQHAHGEDNVHAIINLALTRGFVGREGCGLMPIRGHSGVQGGAEMGAYATVFPGGLPINEENARRLSALYGFEVPSQRGLTAPEMVEAAHRGELDLLFSVGGNFHEVLPRPDFVREALERVPLRVHMDIVLSPPMFFEPGEAVLLLPAATRYEGPGGVTETTTERRVIFSPEIPGPRIGEARPEWWVFGELAARVRPELADRVRFPHTSAIREEIARVIPQYDGIQHLRKKGDQFQYGGPRLCEGWRFPTPDGKARFKAVPLPRVEIPEGAFRVATRRGKQFNSMVQEDVDPLNGLPRDAVLMHPADAERLKLRPGDRVRLYNAHGVFYGRVFLGDVKPGSLQIHWPEGNVLAAPDVRSPLAGIPAYKGIVAYVEKVTD